MNNILLSVIVPVYNTGEYLYRCVDSIISQSLEEIEIILVNDGSTDNSGEICDAYLKKDNRVRVIHKKNAGVSIARNEGIQVARGNYIGFVDSDDWIDSEMYESMVKAAETTDADVVMCDAKTVYEDGKIQMDTITQLAGNQSLKKTDFTPSLLLEMAGSACRCIYKNNKYSYELQKSHELLFPFGVKFSEDRIFNLYAFGQSDKIFYIKEPFYNRYVNKKSAVHRFHEDYFEAYKKAAKGIQQAIRDVWEDNIDLQRAYLGQFINGAVGAICNYYYKASPLTTIEKKKMVERLCEDRQLRTAIETYGADRKSQWILDRKYGLLIGYARLANWKHGR